jgi:hypothetical protein
MREIQETLCPETIKPEREFHLAIAPKQEPAEIVEVQEVVRGQVEEVVFEQLNR